MVCAGVWLRLACLFGSQGRSQLDVVGLVLVTEKLGSLRLKKTVNGPDLDYIAQKLWFETPELSFAQF